MHTTKSEAKKALGMGSDAALARYLNVSKAAVGKWDEHKPLPFRRQWLLHLKRPDLFPWSATDTERAA